MSGLDKDRKRNQTVCFRMTPEERRELEARITVSGLPKGKYFIQSVLYQEVKIAVGKYQSDRLSLEIRRLWERLEHLETEDLYEVLADCRALMQAFLWSRRYFMSKAFCNLQRSHPHINQHTGMGMAEIMQTNPFYT